MADRRSLSIENRYAAAPSIPGPHFYRLDRDGRFVSVHSATLRVWGRTRQEVIGRHIAEVFPQILGSAAWAEHELVARRRRPARLRTISPLRNCWIDLALHPERGGGISASFQDVAPERPPEAAALELGHRLANDMQFVLSQLQLAKLRLDGHPAGALLDAAIARAAFSGWLQRQLIGPPTEPVPVAPILGEVVRHALGRFRDVAITLDLAPVVLPRARLAPLVLLVWEAASNAAKHVFAQALGRRFAVALTQEGAATLSLSVSDDGPGLRPPLAEGARGLGQGIMRDLAAQLGGTLETAPGPGTRLSLRFVGGDAAAP